MRSEVSFVLSFCPSPCSLSVFPSLSGREVGNPRRQGWERRRRDSDVRSGARCGPVATPARLGIQLTATLGTRGVERVGRFLRDLTGRLARRRYALDLISRSFCELFPAEDRFSPIDVAVGRGNREASPVDDSPQPGTGSSCGENLVIFVVFAKHTAAGFSER